MSKDQYQQLTITDIDRSTKDAVIVSLKPSAEQSNNFSYKPGQYLTLRHQFEDTEYVRSYSICSIPDSGNLQIGVRLVEGGKFSSHLNCQAKIGDQLSALTPRGIFTMPSLPSGSKAIFIGAGSGITPLFPLIHQHLQASTDNQASLIFQNHNSIRMMLRDTLLFLKNKYLDQFQWINFFSTPQENSVTNKRFQLSDLTLLQKKQLIPSFKETAVFFLCGPEELTQAIKHECLHQGVERKNIRLELFNNPNQIKAAPKTKLSVDATITITCHGVTNKVPIDIADIAKTGSVLNIGKEAGLDVPYSCQAGVCSTCKAKLLSGKVLRQLDHVLTQEEKDRGFILTCQAIPNSEDVSVSYDEV